MMIPEWKPVVGYEGLYIVSSIGHVKSLFRYKRILKYNINKRGYASVELFKNGESKRLLVHRLVAQAFIPNPDNLPQINHLDENPLNNAVSNLEWCTAKYNDNYGNRNAKIKAHTDYTTEDRKRIARSNGAVASKSIIQQRRDGISIRYMSAKQASRLTGIAYRRICDAANGKQKTAGKCSWIYEGG